MVALHTQVLTWVFVLALLLGAISQKTHFCTMGALSDAYNMGDDTRLRQWVLAMAVAMLGFGVLAYKGFIDPYKTIYANKHWLWLSFGVGGGLFGFGMVLAGILLDHVQHWKVFQACPELFILVPALLGLKGNTNIRQ